MQFKPLHCCCCFNFCVYSVCNAPLCLHPNHCHLWLFHIKETKWWNNAVLLLLYEKQMGHTNIITRMQWRQVAQKVYQQTRYVLLGISSYGLATINNPILHHACCWSILTWSICQLILLETLQCGSNIREETGHSGYSMSDNTTHVTSTPVLPHSDLSPHFPVSDTTCVPHPFVTSLCLICPTLVYQIVHPRNPGLPLTRIQLLLNCTDSWVR